MLTKGEIYRIVNDFIGVHNGYLGGFSYRTHYEFYPYYCDVEIDVADYEPGTTREKFIQILENVDARTQAKILRGVLTKYPAHDDEDAARASTRSEIRDIIVRLESQSPVKSPDLGTSVEVVEAALDDAEALMATRGPRSAVDRVHTALHGYLKAACREAGITITDGARLDELFKRLRTDHPAFADVGSAHVGRVYAGLAQVASALNPTRNTESLAHPNEALLDEQDAHLVVNAVRSMLHYIDGRIRDARKDT